MGNTIIGPTGAQRTHAPTMMKPACACVCFLVLGLRLDPEALTMTPLPRCARSIDPPAPRPARLSSVILFHIFISLPSNRPPFFIYLLVGSRPNTPSMYSLQRILVFG